MPVFDVLWTNVDTGGMRDGELHKCRDVDRCCGWRVAWRVRSRCGSGVVWRSGTAPR